MVDRITGGLGPMVDLIAAGAVEFVVDSANKIWVNIDGICRLRVGNVEIVRLDMNPLSSAVQAGMQQEQEDARATAIADECGVQD